MTTERCCSRDCKTKDEMRAVHGAPQEFWESLLTAQADGFITMGEAKVALDKYVVIYNSAPEEKSCLDR